MGRHQTPDRQQDRERAAGHPADHVRLLLQLYGIGAPEADTLIRLAAEANQRGWWASYGDTVPDWFRNFVGLEADASEINGYDSELVPGQLQTAEYAEAVILAARPNAARDELQRRVTFRHERQQRLVGSTSPRLHFVLNEAVLRRPVGGADAFRQQLDHLTEMAQLPHVDLQVLPFSAGPHAAMGETFRVVRFPATRPGSISSTRRTTAARSTWSARPMSTAIRRSSTSSPQQPWPAPRPASSSLEYEVRRANESRHIMDLTGAIWRKSQHSNGAGGDCVEVADLNDGGRAVRDSKNPTGPALMFTAVEWVAFTAGVRAGEFDCSRDTERPRLLPPGGAVSWCWWWALAAWIADGTVALLEAILADLPGWTGPLHRTA